MFYINTQTKTYKIIKNTIYLNDFNHLKPIYFKINC